MSDSSALITCPRETMQPVIMAEALALKEKVLAGVALFGEITTQEQNLAAVQAVADVTILIKQIEHARAAAKEPYLRAGQAIDAIGRDLLKELKAEELRVNTACGNFITEQENKVREIERQRQREIDRIQQQREAQERAASAEADRIERERQAKVRAEQDRIAAEHRLVKEAAAQARTKAAFANAERKRLELEQELASLASEAAVEAKVEQARQNALRASRDAEFAQQVEDVGPQVMRQQTAGQQVKIEWDFEVVNVVNLVKVRPDLVRMEAKRAEIMELINQHGVRELAGLRVFERAKINIKPKAVGGKAIEV